jgi:hypothetical protein
VVIPVFLLTLGLLSCGGSAKQSSSAPSTNSGASAPAGATVLANIQAQPWQTCGACGNDGGTGSIADSSFTVGIGSPSESGASTQFAIAATVPYSNAYFFQDHPVIQSQIAYLAYEFDFYVPNGMENLPQAFEFECQQRFNGWTYNFSWQANYSENTWRVFNYSTKHWEESGLTFQHLSPGSWHHLAAEYHNDVSTHSVFHDALTVDGVRLPVNMRHDAVNEGAGDEFSNAVQLDSNLIPDPYRVYVDKMKITYK